MTQSRYRLTFAILLLPLIVGCDGCRQVGQDPNANQQNPNEPKLAYSTEPAVVFPNDINTTFGAVKPGHSMTGAQSLRSNKADMRGDLRTQTSMNRQNIDMETTGVSLSHETVRPVVLPKGQMRQFDYRFICPIPNSVDTQRISIASRLIPRSGGVFDTGAQPFVVMKGPEYFFVVLTKRPEQYARFQVANWSRAEEDSLDRVKPQINYRIVVPDASGLLPLPETMLDWSSIGVVFWDDVSEDALTPFQTQALADWIRFGGRLVINGPAGSDAVANTALADLLPLYPTSNIELDPAAAAELVDKWSVATDRSKEKQLELIRSESGRIAVDGRLEPGGKAIDDTASLVLERKVGRGHVVQPRIDLTESWLESWDSYDSFFNAVILNRPSRVYVGPRFDENDDITELSLYFSGTKTIADAGANSRFRVFSRDGMLAGATGNRDKGSGSLFDEFHRVDAMSGFSAWNDRSDSIRAMRNVLVSEAGIEIPGSSLVVRSLVIYLIVLVPINFVVFRLMNRLEYAWFAVPVIAILGAIFAARQAQLDIGFARSNTELGLLEVHSGYHRGHLTRLVGVYNSLSSRYELQFPSPDGIAMPLSNEPDPGTNVQPVTKTSYAQGPSLDDFAVPSNRMRLVHTEEMVDLGGTITLSGQNLITNEASMELLDAVCIRRLDSGETVVASLGSLMPGESKTAEFISTDRIFVADNLPMKTDRLIRQFADPRLLADGSTRLVARIDGSPNGVQIEPAASQTLSQTIVLVHLEVPDLPERIGDENLASDFRRVNKLENSDDDSSQD